MTRERVFYLVVVVVVVLLGAIGIVLDFMHGHPVLGLFLTAIGLSLVIRFGLLVRRWRREGPGEL